MNRSLSHGELLYHYTTANGFTGILRTQSIRATNFSFLNDRSEIAFGRELGAKWLRSRHFVDPQYSADELIELLEMSQELSEVYVACFTSRRDELSQWRGYGSCRADRFCLGFDAKDLMKLRAAGDSNAPVNLIELVYSQKKQRSVLRDAMQTPAPYAHHRALAIETAVARFKHRAFVQEREWRLLVSTLGTGGRFLEFSDGDTPRPFINLLMPKEKALPVKEVLVLPARDRKQATKAARLVVERYGYAPDMVKVSDIPFVG